MNKKFHISTQAESDLGVGSAYVEVIENTVVRQIEIYNELYFWATTEFESDPRFSICVKPFDQVTPESYTEISESQFNEIWRQAGGPTLR